jgi:hypothetical protein
MILICADFSQIVNARLTDCTNVIWHSIVLWLDGANKRRVNVGVVLVVTAFAAVIGGEPLARLLSHGCVVLSRHSVGIAGSQ